MLAAPPQRGVIFPLGYILLSSQSLSGPPVLQGMLWAGLLWFVAEVIMAPMLGAEVFSTALGGLPAALRALLGYLVYGATLGSVVGTVQPEAQVRITRLMSETLLPEPDVPWQGHPVLQGVNLLYSPSLISFKSSLEN